MKLLLLLSVLLNGVAVSAAAQEARNYKQLQDEGFRVAGTHLEDDDLVIVLERGEHSFVCTLTLKRTGSVYTTGPWNTYRDCNRMSGGADLHYNLNTGDLEVAK